MSTTGSLMAGLTIDLALTEGLINPDIPAQRLHLLDESGALLTCGQIFPTPLANHDDPEQFQQAWNDWEKIDGVENAFDQILRRLRPQKCR